MPVPGSFLPHFFFLLQDWRLNPRPVYAGQMLHQAHSPIPSTQISLCIHSAPPIRYPVTHNFLVTVIGVEGTCLFPSESTLLLTGPLQHASLPVPVSLRLICSFLLRDCIPYSASSHQPTLYGGELVLRACLVLHSSPAFLPGRSRTILLRIIA